MVHQAESLRSFTGNAFNCLLRIHTKQVIVVAADAPKRADHEPGESVRRRREAGIASSAARHATEPAAVQRRRPCRCRRRHPGRAHDGADQLVNVHEGAGRRAEHVVAGAPRRG